MDINIYDIKSISHDNPTKLPGCGYVITLTIVSNEGKATISLFTDKVEDLKIIASGDGK